MLGRVELTNKLVSQKLGIDEREVCKVMSFTYQELANEFQECTYPYLYVKDLGTFAILQKGVRNRLYRLNRSRKGWRSYDDSNPKKAKALKTITTEMFKLFDINRMLKKIKVDRLKAKANAKTINDNKG